MKKLTSILALVLCLVLALASCGNTKTDGTTAAQTTEPATELATEPAATTDELATDAQPTERETTAEITEIPVTVDKWESISTKVNGIAPRDRNLKFEYDSYSSSSKAAKNDVYLKGPDALDFNTPEIQVMVYERNKAACELLGTTIEYVFWNYGWGQQAGQIDVVVKGKAADAPDLFVNMLYDLNTELLKGTFKDVLSIPNDFFDFSASGWLEEWMKNLSLTGDRAYVLGGDYFLDVFRTLALLPFNMTMMDANADLLAPYILPEGETLEVGEKLSAYFFDLVDDGNWTWDVLGNLSEAIWVDSDGDGQDSIRDRLGIIADENQGFSAGGFVYSAGERMIEQYSIEDEASQYYEKQWIKYADDSSGLNTIFDAVKAVFDGKGSLSTYASPSSNTPENPGLAYHHTKFAAGELLFGGVCLLGGLEDAVFQQMRDLYSVVPCPKTNASNPYNTIIYNTGDAGAINVNSNSRKARVLSAYLQYCTENSKEIRDEFLQIVMKYKVTTYNQGTDRMLDLIYDSILYDRDKTVEDLIEANGGLRRWHSMMKIEHFSVGSDYIVEQYQSLRGSKQIVLDGLLRTWYTLPKVEPAAE